MLAFADLYSQAIFCPTIRESTVELGSKCSYFVHFDQRGEQMSNSYEIDFHPVGDASRSGDAISAKISVGNQWETVVIDGGTKDSGEALVHAIAKN